MRSCASAPTFSATSGAAAEIAWKFARFDAHDARGSRRAQVRQERRAENDRYLAEEFARGSLAHDAFDAVDRLRNLGFALEDDEQCAPLAFVCGVFPRLQMQVGAAFGKAIELCVGHGGKERDRPQFVEGDH